MQGPQQGDLRATSPPPIQRTVMPINTTNIPPQVNKVISPRGQQFPPGFPSQLPPNIPNM